MSTRNPEDQAVADRNSNIMDEIGEFNGLSDLMTKTGMVENSEDSPELSAESENTDSLENTDSIDNNQDDSAQLSADSPLPNSDDSENSDIEMLRVKGADGRRQKLEINYSDRKAIKQAFIKAAGMRKFQLERDGIAKEFEATKTEYAALQKDFNRLEEAFETGGPRAIVELLQGEGAWDAAVDKANEDREYRANLSAEEKYRLELEERDAKYQSQLASERSQREKFEKQIQEREETAELQQLESQLHPAFDRYRFSGKLDDPATENFYDEAIWEKAVKRLGEYPDNVKLTQAIVDKEFRTVANMFNKHIKAQTERQVKSSVTRKKNETAKRAQLVAKKGLSPDTNKQKMIDSLKGGDLKGAMSLWRNN